MSSTLSKLPRVYVQGLELWHSRLNFLLEPRQSYGPSLCFCLSVALPFKSINNHSINHSFSRNIQCLYLIFCLFPKLCFFGFSVLLKQLFWRSLIIHQNNDFLSLQVVMPLSSWQVSWSLFFAFYDTAWFSSCVWHLPRILFYVVFS